MIFGAINGFITAAKQKKLADKINPIDVTREADPYAKEMLAGARLRRNSRMGGAATLERSIAQNQANTMATVQNNATSGAQVLSMAAAGQGQANDSAARLTQMEAADEAQKANELQQAQGVMIQEGDKVYEDRLRKFLQDRRAKDALMQSSLMNKANALGSIDNAIGMVGGAMLGNPAMFGLGGGKKPGGFPPID